MELVIKEVGIESLKELVQMRIDFISDLHPEYDPQLLAQLREASVDYFQQQLSRDSYLGFIGTASERKED